MLRPISHSEAAVLRRALEVGAGRAIPSAIFDSLSSLQVTAMCKCGCATVWFGPKGDATVGEVLADAVATSNDQTVQVIVWSQGEAIVGLEVVGVPGALTLPVPSSVRSWGEA